MNRREEARIEDKGREWRKKWEKEEWEEEDIGKRRRRLAMEIQEEKVEEKKTEQNIEANK